MGFDVDIGFGVNKVGFNVGDDVFRRIGAGDGIGVGLCAGFDVDIGFGAIVNNEVNTGCGVNATGPKVCILLVLDYKQVKSLVLTWVVAMMILNHVTTKL